eukprot:CAMPEP_0117602618 /NCGR_PEP_ID=MMETSP0784-20121206/77678_1 /TAXON_ID=39447 /ORGANISM="" /LENGTH=174 /DNA_ID=CAMNT_0005405451 /DNA_START=77 /DNA_END=598 /DNA_ORIENTATION=-
MRSQPIVYQGGKWNVVGLRMSESGGLEHEIMGPGDLQAMVVRLHKLCPRSGYDDCAVKHARFPSIVAKWPIELIREMSEALSPLKDPPRVLDETAPPTKEELVVFNMLPYPVQLRWVWLAERPEDSVEVQVNESKKVHTVQAPMEGKPSVLRVKAGVGQMFHVVGSKASGSRVS